MPHALGFVSYKCQSIVQTGRLEKILTTLSNIPFICLQGTRIARQGTPYRTFKLSGYLVIQVGYVSHDNEHAGLAICVRLDIMRRAHIVSIQCPGKSSNIAGRAMQVRIKGPGWDFTIANVYFPSWGSNKNVCRQKAIIHELIRWISQRYRAFAARSLYLLMWDLNTDFLNAQTDRNHSMLPSDEALIPTIGPHVGEKENFTGKQIRQMAEDFYFAVLSTFYPYMHTFYDLHGGSHRLDHYLIQAHQMHRVLQYIVLDAAGFELQLEDTHLCKDHRPVFTKVLVEYFHSRIDSAFCAWALFEALKKGHKRRELLELIEQTCADNVYKFIRQIRESGRRMFFPQSFLDCVAEYEARIVSESKMTAPAPPFFPAHCDSVL